MLRQGRVTGYKIGKNRNGDHDVLLLQVQFSNSADVQTVELPLMSGEDTNPPLGSKVWVESIGEAYKVALAIDDGIAPEKLSGEKKYYSSSGGVIKAFIEFLVSGISNWWGTTLNLTGTTKITATAPVIELNGNADFAVQFTALETAFNTLKSEFNAHVHGGVFPGVASTSPTTASAADISGAKVTTVKLP